MKAMNMPTMTGLKTVDARMLSALDSDSSRLVHVSTSGSTLASNQSNAGTTAYTRYTRSWGRRGCTVSPGILSFEDKCRPGGVLTVRVVVRGCAGV